MFNATLEGLTWIIHHFLEDIFHSLRKNPEASIYFNFTTEKCRQQRLSNQYVKNDVTRTSKKNFDLFL